LNQHPYKTQDFEGAFSERVYHVRLSWNFHASLSADRVPSRWSFQLDNFYTFFIRSPNNESVAREFELAKTQMSLRRLRTAIQKNVVSFPSQIPKFNCQSRADVQWRLAELYFIHNWTCPELGRRYGVTMERARQLVFNWVQRAIVLGYLQEIPAPAPCFEDPSVSREGGTAIVGESFVPEPGTFAQSRENVVPL
jgi:hypothetical protein